MAEKKRKGVASAPIAPPPKKSKKSSLSEPAATTSLTVNELAAKPPSMTNAVAKSMSGRKRAVDFLGDDEKQAGSVTEPVQAAKASKKAKKSATPEALDVSRRRGTKPSLTADGVNGVTEHNNDAEVDIATAKEPSSTSLEAEALRIVDHELEEENGSDNEDQGAALLAGFDSDSEDPAEDQGDMTKPQPIPQYKKTSKKLRLAQEKGSDGPGTVYVGRIPHGFYEQPMRDYFSQFGTISRLRLSRNRRTGASKHFAFIEFESDEVAKIVAETMDNYLMFGHILKCKYAPAESLHRDVWKGANKKYRKIPHAKLERQKLEAPKTQEQWAKKNEREKRKRQIQAEKMKAIGYEYVVPELKAPSDRVEHRKIEEEHQIPAATGATEDQPNAIEAAPPVPADEVALKKAQKKSKKPAAGGRQEYLTVGNLDARNAGPAAESAKISQNAQDRKNNIASDDTRPEVSAKTPSKKPPKAVNQTSSTVMTESSHGDYDNLSSIPVGIEAAPAHVTDAVPADSVDEPESFSTQLGVADAILAGRKSDRRKAKSAGKSRKKTAEAQTAKIAPGVTGAENVEKGQKLKGILKKGGKAGQGL